MAHKKFWFVGALALLLPGIALFMAGSAPAGNREVAAIQKAIAAEKLQWQAGTYTIRFRVSDTIAEDTQNVTISVTNVKRVHW